MTIRLARAALADIIVYGESLGSRGGRPRGEGDFQALIPRAMRPTRWAKLAAFRKECRLPLQPMLLDRYESDKHIGKVRAPLLIIHGEKDETIPVAMGRGLFDAANEPKRMVTFPNAGHADHFMYGSYDAINTWIDALRGAGR